MICCRCNSTGNCKNCFCVKNGKTCSDSLLRRLEKCQNNGMAPGIQTTVSGSSTHQAAAQNTLSLLSSTTSSMTSSAVSNQATTSTHHIKPEVKNVWDHLPPTIVSILKKFPGEFCHHLLHRHLFLATNAHCHHSHLLVLSLTQYQIQ